MNHDANVNKKGTLIIRPGENVVKELVSRAFLGGYTQVKYNIEVPNLNEYVNDVLAQHIASEPLTKRVTVQRKATAEA